MRSHIAIGFATAFAGAAPGPALGQAVDGGGGGLLGGPLLLIAAMGLFMYALIIRPQQRREKEHQAMLSQVEKGDKVVTTGGLHAKVVGLTDDVLTVEIADRVQVKLSKSAVASRTPRPTGKKS